MSHPLDIHALYHCECGEWHYKCEVFLPPCKQAKAKQAKAKKKRRSVKR